jgi:outer membrane protein OmpA-like peptidoglycan-associated protein
MRTFAQKPKASQHTKTADSTKLSWALSGRSNDEHSILQSQRTTHNQAVQQLPQASAEELQAGSAITGATRFGHEFSRISIQANAITNIQPKVNTPAAVNEQEDDQQPAQQHVRPSPELTLHRALGHQVSGRLVQPKLIVGAFADPDERAADRVAEQVMRMPQPQVQRQTCACGKVAGPDGMCEACKQKRLNIQRKASGEGAQPAAPPIVHEVLCSPGQPLDVATRAFFEPRFGTDFDQVRVHTDAKAAESARAVKALAYTVGQNIVFREGLYAPGTSGGQRLLAHELVHIVQQGGTVPQTVQSEGELPAITFQRNNEHPGSPLSGVIQRAGDPAAIPPGFPCRTDLTAGRPAGTDVLFTVGGSTITAAHTAQLTIVRDTWVAAGGTDDILVHGYASTEGDQGANWTLSCSRAEAVRAELVRLGVPAVRINVVAHGESTDFGSSVAPNRHAVVSTSAPGIMALPLAVGVLTARDNFAGRSVTRYGVGETIDLSFFSLPPRPAVDFGGLEWHLVSGGGKLTAGVTPVGIATYTAPATAGAVQLELRVASGATAGRVISLHAITIVIPDGVRITELPGTAPNFGGTIPAGTWGAGFLGNVFVDPKDVSFQGVVFGEGTKAGVVKPAGSFMTLGPITFAGIVHPANTFGPAHGGNAVTGTRVSPPPDNIFSGARAPTGSLFGLPTCGASDFLWAIPWEFSVAGGPRTPFTTANHHQTSTFFCNATIEKAGAGPFCRTIKGTTC